MQVKVWPAWSIVLIVLLVLGGVFGGQVWAQAAHPFGAPEQGVSAGGPDVLRRFFGFVSYWQSHFYRQLTGAVRAWQEQGGWGGLLIGLSFAYGVFHALGPGHGKAVIASYVLANRQTARNGAVLALAASLVQALVAIALVSVLALVFNVTAGVMNEATRWLEITAYAMVVVLGLMLVWRKALRPLVRAANGGADHARDQRHAHGHHSDAHAHQHAGDHPHAHDHQHDHGHAHSHAHSHDDCCGHAHVPPPETMAGALSLRRAWVAILAIGLRPCSGALIVLVFALAQDFYFAGVASALAMGVGTGLTVAMLAVLSVWAGSATTRLGGMLSSRAAIWVRYAIESMAAVLVLALGALLLGATLFGSGTGG